MRTKTKYRAVCHRCDKVLSEWHDADEFAEIEKGVEMIVINPQTGEFGWVCKGCQ